MPKRTIGNPSKHQDSLRRGLTSGSFPDFREVRIRESCDLCAERTRLREQTVNGERAVVCLECLRAAGIPLTEWKKVTSSLPEPSPDLRAIRQRIHVPRGTPLSHRTERRRCSYTSCRRGLKKWQIACPEHWSLVPDELKKEFLKSYRTPERREAWKRIERYLVMRARFKGLAS